MAFEINNLKTNKDMETEGVWIDEEGGLRLKIARLNNPNYKRAIARGSKPYRKQIANGAIDKIGDKMEEVVRKAYAKHILLDWKNLVEDGIELEYSEAEAYRLLGIQEFFEIVESHAQDAELYRDAEREESEGN